jgi:hypothetical protein
MRYHAIRDEDARRVATTLQPIDEDEDDAPEDTQSDVSGPPLAPGRLVANALDQYAEVNVADALRPTAAESAVPYIPRHLLPLAKAAFCNLLSPFRHPGIADRCAANGLALFATDALSTSNHNGVGARGRRQRAAQRQLHAHTCGQFATLRARSAARRAAASAGRQNERMSFTRPEDRS